MREIALSACFLLALILGGEAEQGKSDKSVKRGEVLPVTPGGFLENGPENEKIEGVCEADDTRNLLNCDIYNGLPEWTISDLIIAVTWSPYNDKNARDYEVPVMIAPHTTEHVTFRLGLQLPPDEIFKFPDGKVSKSKGWHWQNVGARGFPQPAKSKSLSSVFSNERLKRGELKDYPVTGDDQWRSADGMWVPESKEPAKALLFPEQVRITCANSDKTCRELSVTLGVMGGLVEVMGPDEKIWQISSWDEHGLLATYDADPSANALSEKCHRHVLSMSFASGVVSTSDIPTHEKGCETFKTTDSYRLVRGEYYVDTTPGNDGGKPINPNK